MSSLLVKAFIIDDEEKSRSIMRTMLTRYCPSVQIVGMASNVEDAYRKINEVKPNLLLLDVEMPYGSGFELLKRFHSFDFEVIFVTGFDHYALKAIKFHALDYLLKPVDIDELIAAIEKVEDGLKQKEDSKRLEQLLSNLQNPESATHQIVIPTMNERQFIPIKDIMYCQAEGGCTWFYLNGRKNVFSSKNLGEYEKILPEPNENLLHTFFRVHHSFLINLQYIETYNKREGTVQMKDGVKINIAQRRRSTFSEVTKQKGWG